MVEPPKKAYKYVSLADADKVASGSILIGTLDHYHRREGDRGDPLEGRAIMHIDHHESAGRTSAYDKSVFSSMGFDINVDSASTITRNVTGILSVPPVYIYCCSSEPDFEYAAKEGLAIFEISDPARFGSLVIEAASGLLRSDGRCAPVKYSPRSVNPFQDGPIKPHPYVKDPKFAWEKEIRFLWFPNEKHPEDTLILQVDGLTDIVKRIAQARVRQR